MWNIFKKIKIRRKNKPPEILCAYCKIDCPDNPKLRNKYNAKNKMEKS